MTHQSTTLAGGGGGGEGVIVGVVVFILVLIGAVVAVVLAVFFCRYVSSSTIHISVHEGVSCCVRVPCHSADMLARLTTGLEITHPQEGFLLLVLFPSRSWQIMAGNPRR